MPRIGARPAPRRAAALQVLYDLVYLVASLLCAPVLVVLFLVRRSWRTGLWERLGYVESRRGTRPAVWIHGVSAGEILAAKELVRLIHREMPWIETVFSTGTVTGWEAAQHCYAGHRVFFWPLDFSFVCRRTLTRIRPSLVLLMELELWPNYLLATSQAGVPVVLVNGRMSQRSARDYKVLQRVIPEPMDRVAHYCVQSEEYADRFRALGVSEERISVTGSVKFDNVATGGLEESRRVYERRLGLDPGAFVLVAGSTHPGEEQVILAAYLEMRQRDPGARLVLCPRHPERRSDWEALVRASGLDLVRISTLSEDCPDRERVSRAVILVDTVGELARIYILADLVFVGGSLTRRGGQNMMEPAGLGKAVVVGPNTWNFRDPVELLLTRGGLSQQPDAESVKRELVALHADADRRRALAERAREVCLESKGATRRILDILRDYVPETAAPPAQAEPVRGEGSS